MFWLKPVADKGMPSEKLPVGAQKPKFWKVSLVSPAVTPSPVFSRYLPRAAGSFMGPAASCHHLGKQKVSQPHSHHPILPADLTLHLQYFFRQKKTQSGEERLFVDCCIYGIIFERCRKMHGSSVLLHR